MPKFKPLFIVSCLMSVGLIMALSIPATAWADSAKQRYLEADSCYQQLRKSKTRWKKATEWLNCIKKYESIYKVYPHSLWAPAGMYRAADLYLTLSRLSGRTLYKDQSKDLLIRVRNKYPKSAYASRAKTLMAKHFNGGGTTTAAKTVKKAPKKKPSGRHIQSLKSRTQKLSLIKKSNQRYQQSLVKTPPPKPKPKVVVRPKPSQPRVTTYQPPKGDTTVTDLRFWSNPEYTRIVVNADQEREYAHRLLKKDPQIGKPFQRLYVDIEQSRLGGKVPEHTAINDNLLKQARAGQYLPHTVRVVVDIKSFENYKIFSLKDPFRIVIDVWGKGSNGSPVEVPDTAVAGSSKGKKTNAYTTDNLESSDIARQLALGVRKIVIDPGHGGSDPGAPGYFKNVWEKDIVLKIAKKLAVTLRDRLQCTVVLTRSTDRKLTLEERTAIANTQRADLFISLHCNAAKNRKLAGIETYILNLATDEQAIAVAARENATSEKNISDLEYILSDLMKHAKIEESTRLANVVHSAFVGNMKKKYSRINNLGVKRAPFYVLLGARMPSILIETSFLSNKEECKRLMTDSYQTHISDSIALGVEKYIKTTNPKQLAFGQ